jgi:hypothetical protein
MTVATPNDDGISNIAFTRADSKRSKMGSISRSSRLPEVDSRRSTPVPRSTPSKLITSMADSNNTSNNSGVSRDQGYLSDKDIEIVQMMDLTRSSPKVSFIFLLFFFCDKTKSAIIFFLKMPFLTKAEFS